MNDGNDQGTEHRPGEGSQVPRSVVFAANERYFPGLYCAMASMLAHCAHVPLKVYVMDGGLSDESRRRLDELAASHETKVEVRLVALTLDRFSGFPLGPGQSFMTYARLVLPELLTGEERVLCLDADLLVFADAAQLAARPLAAGCLLAAVRDAEIHSTQEDSPQVASALGQDASRGYFNAGVMVMDLGRMRARGFTARVMEFLCEYGSRCRFHDQSAINFVFGDQIDELPRMWNTPAWMFDRDSWPDEVPERVIHFTNEAPWLRDSGGTCNLLFRRYAAMAGVPVDETTDEFRRSKILARRRDAEAPLRALAYAAVAIGCRLPPLRARRAGYEAAARHWWRHFTGAGDRRLLHEKNLAAMEKWLAAARGGRLRSVS